MGRHLLILAVLLVGCDEEDPATSEHCVMVRMRFIEQRFRRDQVARNNPTGPVVLSVLDAALARLQSENWQCFR